MLVVRSAIGPFFFSSEQVPNLFDSHITITGTPPPHLGRSARAPILLTAKLDRKVLEESSGPITTTGNWKFLVKLDEVPRSSDIRAATGGDRVPR